MLDSNILISQYEDPETLPPEDFQLFVRESEQVRKIEQDLAEDISTLGGEKYMTKQTSQAIGFLIVLFAFLFIFKRPVS